MSVLVEKEAPRIFLAARVSDDVVAMAQDFRTRLDPQLFQARWTHPDDLHVTLKFFGATPRERIVALTGVVAETCATSAPFFASFAGIDFFTPRRKPQILWAKVQEGYGAFGALVARLDTALESVGFVREARAFQPHLTLARLSSEALRHGEDALARATFTTPSFQVDALTLFASDLTAPRHAARYRALQVFPLRGTPLAVRQEDHS